MHASLNSLSSISVFYNSDSKIFHQIQVPETDEEKSKDDEVKEFFRSISGEDLEVDCYELQEILNFALKKGNIVFFGMTVALFILA